MQCAHLPFRRQQGSSHPLTCHGMVPQASRTHFSGITKPRDFRRGVSCWRYLSSQAVSSQVLSAEASLTDLSRDGAAGIPNCTLPDTTKPRDFRRGVSCWRYLSSQAVSSQVLSAEANLTDLSRDGAAGIPNSLFRHSKTPRLSSRGFVLALPIFPGRLQPSIVSRSELNFRVRDGNGWTLALISTNYSLEGLHLQNRTTKEVNQEGLDCLQIVGQALGLLVPVSCTRYRASTSGLSTRSSFWALTP